ncbi:MAG: vitamin B12 dependent-methionine synthase activation domain-containing protein [Eubacteriales bacterium]|nr:vitamin B12 dependent-methionine synthase activation domain-containing protein [Eubacteriales bacterium]
MFRPTARLTKINYNEVLMYLGHRGQDIDSSVDEQIRRCIDIIANAAAPKLTWRMAQVRDGMPEGFALPGKDIRKLLESSEQAVFLAVTLGAGIDRLLLQYEIRDMADAFILDACAAAAVENVCNNFEEDIKAGIDKRAADESAGTELPAKAESGGNKTYYLTDRFSPGYGDLPIETQKLFAEFLNTSRTIGVNVTENYLMIPRKSVTAVLGISNVPQSHRASGCEVCSMFRTCPYRKNGSTCTG